MTETQYTKVPVKDCGEKVPEEPSKYGYGVRHVQSFLFFMCLSLGYIARAHIGVTIVAMTNLPTKETSLKADSTIESIAIDPHVNISQEEEYYTSQNATFMNVTRFVVSAKKFGEENQNVTSHRPEDKANSVVGNDTGSIWNIYRTYDWPKSTQEMILGAFFLGYFIMMFPMGLVCQRFGGKLPLQIALFVNGIVSLVVPWMTAWGGWKVLCACRVLQGLSQAGIYPALHTLLANWVPVSERGTLGSYVYTGSGFGTVVAFQLGGILADSRWGWPSIFWSAGLLCLAGFALLTIFGAKDPAQHKSISYEERSFVYGHSGDDSKKKAKTPWKSILTSKHVWACLSAHVGSGVSFVFFFSQVPTYMHAILQFNIKSSGLLSSLPYITAFFATIAFGYLSDFLTNKKIITLKTARIICNTIGSFGAAICVSIVSYTENKTLAVILFVLSLAFHTACHTGWMMNYIDLAPNYSGAQMAFGNTLCNSMVVVLPFIVSSVVTDVTDRYQWRIMFLLIAGLCSVVNVFYVFFMSADVQVWNDIPETKESEEVKLEEQSVKK